MWNKRDELDLPDIREKTDYETELNNDSGYQAWADEYWQESVLEQDRNTPTLNYETDK